MNKQQVAKLAAAAKHMPTPDIARVLVAFAQAGSQLAQSQQNVKLIESQRALLIAELNHRCGAIHAALGAVFAERRAALDSHFSVIQQGMKANDRELILAGMNAVGEIVSSSPFVDLDNLSKLLESNAEIEI